MEEIWKEIEGYPKYMISNKGRVCSYRRTKRRIISLQPSEDLYLRAQIYDSDGKERALSVSRLVAKAFIPNPLGLEQVNHKNENVQDNRVENLEWCSPIYNERYGTRGKRIGAKLSKRVAQYTLQGKFIKYFTSTIEVQHQLGFNSSSISRACRGILKQSKNFVWKYE